MRIRDRDYGRTRGKDKQSYGQSGMQPVDYKRENLTCQLASVSDGFDNGGRLPARKPGQGATNLNLLER